MTHRCEAVAWWCWCWSSLKLLLGWDLRDTRRPHPAAHTAKPCKSTSEKTDRLMRSHVLTSSCVQSVSPSALRWHSSIEASSPSQSRLSIQMRKLDGAGPNRPSEMNWGNATPLKNTRINQSSVNDYRMKSPVKWFLCVLVSQHPADNSSVLVVEPVLADRPPQSLILHLDTAIANAA